MSSDGNDVDPDRNKLQELESLRETIANWQSQRQRRKFIRRLWPLIENWNSGLPDLRNVFRREEVDLLLQDAVYCMGGKQRYRRGAGFIEFVARAGYKDEPELDKDGGEPVTNRTTAIHRASLRRLPNKIVVLRELFKIYDGFDHTDKYGLTHFYAACRHGLVDVVEKFLERGRNADYLGPGTRDSPLHLALRHDHRDMVAMLLRWRVNPNVVGNCRATPLHVVAQRRYFDVDFAREFFEIYDGTEQKLLVDVRDEFGRTPLHLALQQKNRRMAKLLLRRGADPSLASKAGTTPLHIVCVNSYDDDGFRDEFFEIVENELGLALRYDTVLHEALYRGRIDSFEFLLSRGACPNAANRDGRTVLHALCDGDRDEVELLGRLFELSRYGVRIDAMDRFGNTALHLAARSHHRGSLELLLDRGADPGLVNEAGWTLLHQVCWWHRDDVELLAKLLELEVLPIDARTAVTRNTALHMALMQCGRSNNKRVLELLLKWGADPNAANDKGETPLHLICRRRRDDDLVKFFCEISETIDDRAVRLDVRDDMGRTPLEEAMANTLPRAVEFLLNEGAHLSGFVFRPVFRLSALSYLDRDAVPRFDEKRHDFKLRLASGTMMVLEQLENVGYELDRSDALKIMAFFSKHGLLLDESEEEDWRDDKRFERDAKRIVVQPSLSLYELTQLPAGEAEKRLDFADYFELAQSKRLNELRPRHVDPCARHLCEKLSRRFFSSWALDAFVELIRCRLPILCCRMIVENLTNEDLWRVCLAAKEQDS